MPFAGIVHSTLYRVTPIKLIPPYRRILCKGERKDFLSRILEERNPSLVSDQQIAAHASDLVVAGSDTSASALAACLYYLLKTPRAMRNLQDEVHSTFERYNDIGASSTAALPYLNAVIQEALRMFPPLPLGLPRLVPPGGAIVDGHVVPEGVSCQCENVEEETLTNKRPLFPRTHLPPVSRLTISTSH